MVIGSVMAKKLHYCTGNVIYWGDVKPEEDIEYALPYIGRLHLKDSTRQHKNYNFPALGENIINFKKIFKLLIDTDVPVSAEVELNGADNTLNVL